MPYAESDVDYGEGGEGGRRMLRKVGDETCVRQARRVCGVSGSEARSQARCEGGAARKEEVKR